VAAVGMSRRTIALVLAVALAALATIALISYVKGLEDKAFEGTETIEVFVAKQDIAAGVTGDTAAQQGLIERTTVPAKVRPEGAIRSLEQISGHLAAVQIYKGEIIVQQRFVAPGQGVKNVLPIPEGQQAVSIAISGAPSVGGFVQPGDQVSLIIQTQNRRPGGAVITGPAAGNITKYLMQNLDVIAVGSRIVSSATTTGQTAQEQPAGIFTFAVTPAQAEQLVFASLNTTLYFTLLPANSKPVVTRGRTFANLFG
jgi:Flp pilus assembly protein CpaB